MPAVSLLTSWSQAHVPRGLGSWPRPPGLITNDQPSSSRFQWMVHRHFPSPSSLCLFCQAAERDNQNLEDKVLSLKTDVEESQYRQRHLKGELRSFLEVLDGKIDDLHDFRRGLSKLGTDN